MTGHPRDSGGGGGQPLTFAILPTRGRCASPTSVATDWHGVRGRGTGCTVPMLQARCLGELTEHHSTTEQRGEIASCARWPGTLVMNGPLRSFWR